MCECIEEKIFSALERRSPKIQRLVFLDILPSFSYFRPTQNVGAQKDSRQNYRKEPLPSPVNSWSHFLCSYSLSTHMAIPMPPPTHRAATPLLAPVLFMPYNRVTRIRHPDAPIGWPSAIAPPLMLTCGVTKHQSVELWLLYKTQHTNSKELPWASRFRLNLSRQIKIWTKKNPSRCRDRARTSSSPILSFITLVIKTNEVVVIIRQYEKCKSRLNKLD